MKDFMGTFLRTSAGTICGQVLTAERREQVK